MHDRERVRRRQTFGDVGAPRRKARIVDRHPTFDQRRQGLAFDELHADAAPSVLELEEIVNSANAIARNLACEPNLAPHAFEELLVQAHILRDHFERDDLVELAIFGSIDLSHPAFADAFDDLEPALDGRGRHRIERAGRSHGVVERLAELPRSGGAGAPGDACDRLEFGLINRRSLERIDCLQESLGASESILGSPRERTTYDRRQGPVHLRRQRGRLRFRDGGQRFEVGRAPKRRHAGGQLAEKHTQREDIRACVGGLEVVRVFGRQVRDLSTDPGVAQGVHVFVERGRGDEADQFDLATRFEKNLRGAEVPVHQSRPMGLRQGCGKMTHHVQGQRKTRPRLRLAAVFQDRLEIHPSNELGDHIGELRLSSSGEHPGGRRVL